MRERASIMLILPRSDRNKNLNLRRRLEFHDSLTQLRNSRAFVIVANCFAL